MWWDVLKMPTWNVDLTDLPKDKRVRLGTHPDVELANNVEQRDQSMKPSGVWYSFAGDEYNWSQWLKGNQPDWDFNYDYIYTFDITGNVLQLRTKEDYVNFHEKYLVMYDRDSDKSRFPTYHRPYINWIVVANDYDGIEFYDHWKARTHHLDEPYYLSSLDVDSGCIWNKSAITNAKVIAHRKLKRGHKRYLQNVVDNKNWYTKEPVEEAHKFHGEWERV